MRPIKLKSSYKPVPYSLDKEIGSRLKSYRIRSGKTQQEIAQGLGLSFQQIQKYEKGLSRLTVGALITYANLLDVSADDILYGAQGKTKSLEKRWDDKDFSKLARIWDSIDDDRIKSEMLKLLNALVDTVEKQ